MWSVISNETGVVVIRCADFATAKEVIQEVGVSDHVLKSDSSTAFNERGQREKMTAQSYPSRMVAEPDGNYISLSEPMTESSLNQVFIRHGTKLEPSHEQQSQTIVDSEKTPKVYDGSHIKKPRLLLPRDIKLKFKD